MMHLCRLLCLASALVAPIAHAAGPMQSQLNGKDIEDPAAFWNNIGGGPVGKLGIGAGLSAVGGNLQTPLRFYIAAQTVHDEVIGTDGVVAAASTAFSSPSANFTNQDRGKTIIINGAGVAGADLITTIAAVIDAHNVTLANAATYATPWWTVGRAYHASSTDITTSYAVGEVLTLSGGTTVAGATGAFTIKSLEVSNVTVSSGGSGGANGPCTVMGTTGITRTTWGPAQINAGAIPITSANGWFTAIGTVSGGVLTGPLTIVQPGDYSTAPTSQTAEPVIPAAGGGCAGLTGATVSLKMGPHMLQQTTPGHYTTLPANPVSTVSNGSGVGATLTLWGLAPTGYSLTTQGDQVGGYWAYGTDDTAAINQAIAATQAMNGGTVVLPAGRSLMLGAFNIPYSGTSPPIQPPLEIVGAGNLQPVSNQGGYVSPYFAGAYGSIIDNRYAGGDGAGHVAKLDTRGMGIIRPHGWSLVDWGTDNFLMFLTTNTWPIIRDMTFMGNPTCYQMTCQQNAIRLGGIDGSRTYSGILATDGYQNNSPTVTDSFFEFIQEGIQVGSAANSGTFSNIQSGSTNGSWTTGFYHFYGAGAGTNGNNVFGGLNEMFGYPYIVYMDHVNSTNTQNNFYGLITFDGSGLRTGKNGIPSLASFFFDAASNYNKVDGSPETDMGYNFVVQQGTPLNTILSPAIQPASFLPGNLVAGKLGIGLAPGVNPTWGLDAGPGSGAISGRLNGGNTNSNDGPCFRLSAASVDRITIGTYSGCRGGAADTTGVINANGGRIKFESFNTDIFTLDNGFLSMQAPFQLMNYTVGTLPTCNSAAKGRKAYVTDASAPTYGSTLVGSGAVVVPAFCDGANWVAR